MSLRTLYDEASLWMTPSGYEDGKLFSELPTDGSGDFTFSRGSNLAATRVGPTGLIEKGRENLLTYSNDFSQWSNANTTEASGFEGYDGTNDAWEIEKTGASAYSSINKSITATSGIVTISAYVKKGTLSVTSLYASGGTNPYILFSFDSATIVAQRPGLIDTNVEDAGNGWYRISFTTTESISSITLHPDWSGVNTGTIYVQDVQVEKSLVATDYIETGASTAQAGILEDMPRLDYSGGASCPALLLEPQRTNLFPQSEYLDGWNKYLATAQFDSSITNPNGTSGAYKIVCSAANNAPNIRYNNVVLSGNYSYSVFVKAGNAESMVFGFDDYDGDKVFMRFNFSTNALTEYIDNNNKVTGYDLEPFDNGWYRLWVNVNLANATYNDIFLMVRNLDNSVVDAGDYFYAWGAQYEAGNYPTSYIPTYGSSVTRNFDNATTTSEEDVLTSGEGIVFMEFEINDTTITGYPEVIRIENPSDTTDKFWFYIFDDSDAGEIRFGYRLDDTAVKKVEGSVTLDAMTTAKVAMRLENNNYALYYNGTKQTPTQYAGVVSNLRKITTRGREHFNGLRVKQFAIFNEALSDSELATLTTL